MQHLLFNLHNVAAFQHEKNKTRGNPDANPP